MYELGDAVVIEATFKRKNVLTDPTTVAVTVLAPDGTTSTPAATKVSTGVYEAEVLATMAGTYRYKVVGSGNAAGVEFDSFLVRQPEF